MLKDFELIGHFDRDRDCVVELIDWISKTPVFDQYIQHPKSIRLVYNYVRRVGIRSTVTKIFSRLREQQRNNKISA